MLSVIPDARPDASRPRRSLLVTIFAWAVIGLAALLTPISLISLLMILAGSPGTSTFDPIGFLTVVVGPLAFVAVGVGLLLRKGWAWYVMVVTLTIIILSNLVDLFRDHSLKERTYTSPSGVITTELSGGTPFYAVPILFICIPSLVMLLMRRVRLEFAVRPPSMRSADSAVSGFPPSPGTAPRLAAAPVPPSVPQSHSHDWRVGHVGRDEMYYEELVGDAWQRIPVSGEMLMGRAHHVIYFRSPAEWLGYPEWARDRRDEIIARIKSEFRPPDYEYQGDGPTARDFGEPAPVDSSSARASVAPAIEIPFARMTLPDTKGVPVPTGKPAAAIRSGLPAALISIVLLLSASAFTGWRAIDGLSQGTTRLPMKLASLQRPVSREDEPVMFYASIAIYAIVALGTLGLVIWGLSMAYRSRAEKARQRV